MQPHQIVSRQEWIAARKAHLAHEKEYTRARDRLSDERRALPWVKVDKSYVFDGPGGQGDAGRSVRRTAASWWCSISCSRRIGRRLQELLVLGGWIRAHGSRISPRATPRWSRFRARLCRSSRRSRRGWAGPSTGCPRRRTISITITPFRLRRSRSSRGDKVYNFGTTGFGVEDAPGISVFYPRRGRQHLPHLFVLRPRSRHDERRLSLSRPDAARPPRRGPAVSDGLGAAARPVQAGRRRRRRAAGADRRGPERVYAAAGPGSLACDGAIDGVDQDLGLDEFEPRPLGLVAVERRGQRLCEGVAVVGHALARLFQRLKSLAHVDFAFCWSRE